MQETGRSSKGSNSTAEDLPPAKSIQTLIGSDNKNVKMNEKSVQKQELTSKEVEESQSKEVQKEEYDFEYIK